MHRVFLQGALATLCACSVDIGFEQVDLELHAISPPQYGGGEPVRAANGTAILTQSRISKDGGASWTGIHPQVDPTGAQAWSPAQIVVNTTAFGLGRWDMATDLVTSVNAPFASGVWHTGRSGTILIAAPSTPVIARQPVGGAFTQIALPAPATPPSTSPNVVAIQSNAEATVLASWWGIYRSLDDGASWQRVADASPAVRSIVALDDGRFLVFDAARTARVLDASGTPTQSVTPAFPTARFSEQAVACLGGIVFGPQLTRDLGATWEPLAPEVVGAIDSTSATCGGSYLVAHVFTNPRQWLVKIETLGSLGAVLPVEPASGEGFVRAVSGTIFNGDMAWKPGEAAWSIRPLAKDARTHALADGSLLVIRQDTSGPTVVRSRDDGLTWQTLEAPTAPVAADRVFSDAGTLWASTFAGDLWRSSDDGASWTNTARPSTTGALPRLLGIGGDGALVATSNNTGVHVSHDRGATWTDLPLPADYQLAFITSHGSGVTFDRARVAGEGTAWHLWRDHGLGEAYKKLMPRIGGQGVELGNIASTAVVDADSYLYFHFTTAEGSVWRSATPID